ncbi:MAG: hypothetical protein IPK50_04520 [Fibrobacterota bacterium]|nr:hypothetical protein [Fibrobacterota bacterium]QQS06160.1 MAG: hypothetical protein IPK50_04520 [Fibrobacterota bacterium]
MKIYFRAMFSLVVALNLSLSVVSAKDTPDTRRVFDPTSMQLEHKSVPTDGWIGFWIESSAPVPDSLVFDLERAQVVPGSPMRWEAADSLVAHRWDVSNKGKQRWEARTPSQGIWRLSLRRSSVQWRKVVPVSRLDAVAVTDGKRLLLWGSSDGNVVPPPFRILVRNQDGVWWEDSTDRQGAREYRIDAVADSAVRIYLEKDGHFSLLPLVLVKPRSVAQEQTMKWWTDRPVYRPGDTATLMGIVHRMDSLGRIRPVPREPVRIVVGGDTVRTETRTDGYFLVRRPLVTSERIVFPDWPLYYLGGQDEFEVDTPPFGGLRLELVGGSLPGHAWRGGDTLRFRVRDKSSRPVKEMSVDISWTPIVRIENHYEVRLLDDRSESGTTDSTGVVSWQTPFFSGWTGALVRATVSDSLGRKDGLETYFLNWPSRWRIETMLDPIGFGAERRVRLRARVVDSTFVPCRNGWFRVRHGADRNLLIDTLLRLDSLGQVSFEFTPRGVEPEFLTLLASSDGKMPWSLHNIVLPARTNEFEARMARDLVVPGDTIGFQLVTGMPRKNVLVWAASREGLEDWMVSCLDSRGEFSMELPSLARSRNRIGLVQAVIGESSEMRKANPEHLFYANDLRLRSTISRRDGVLEIEVKDSEGRPAPGTFSVSVAEDAMFLDRQDDFHGWQSSRRTGGVYFQVAVDGPRITQGAMQDWVWEGSSTPTHPVPVSKPDWPVGGQGHGKELVESPPRVHRTSEIWDIQYPEGSRSVSLSFPLPQRDVRLPPTRRLLPAGEHESSFAGLVRTDSLGRASLRLGKPLETRLWRVEVRGVDDRGRDLHEFVRFDSRNP